jgi:hypothetical protein
MDNYTIDTAARFGEIPFVDFTKELVTGVFDCLLEAHLQQLEAYTTFVTSMTQDLSTYINATVDNVSFDDVSAFLTSYPLPTVSEGELTKILGYLQPPTAALPTPTGTPTPTGSASTDKWWLGLINSIGSAAGQLAVKVKDQNLSTQLAAIDTYNKNVTATAAKVPTYSNIQQSIAALIASNKYALLQNMSKQGLLRLVVTEGEVETRITFSTWNSSSSGTETSDSAKHVEKTKQVKASGLLGLFRAKNKAKDRIVTVNTAKSYQRDSSGSRVDIFGRVLIRFKTDYAPLGG